jgi:hypothetical protein
MLRLVFLFFVACSSLFSFARPAQATWYNENIEDGSDIVMMDLRWPWWASGTYYANWNSGFKSETGAVSFYAGFVSSLADGPEHSPNPDQQLQATFRPGNVWSFWGGNDDGRPVRFENVASNLYIKNEYGGEGLSGTVGSTPWPFVRSQRWYTMLARVWQPIGGSSTHAHVGRWIKDHHDGTWHLIGVARLPIPATSFTGNSGFIETLSDGPVVRPLDRRLGYFRNTGNWKKSDTITLGETPFVVVNVVKEQDHEYHAIEYSSSPKLLPQKLTGEPLPGRGKRDFTVLQPDLPKLDAPAVDQINAQLFGHQLAVTWRVPATSSPSLGYNIDVFENIKCEGPPIASIEQRNPSARHALITLDHDRALESAFIRLTIVDVFDQSTLPQVVAATKIAAPAPATLQPESIPGLQYELYHQDTQRTAAYFADSQHEPNEKHHWLYLREIESGTLVRRGLSRGFDRSVREQRQSGYAMVFRGLLRVPEDGFYLLDAQIDGGYQIDVGDQPVLQWDGQHGTTRRTALRAFTAGDHPLKVTYLYDSLPADNLSVHWQGPHFARQPIPLEALRSVPQDHAPDCRIEAEALGDGTGRINVVVKPNGHTIQRTELYLGNMLLADSDQPSVRYDGPLARGENTFWSRVCFDTNQTIDSDRVVLNNDGKPIDSNWTVRNVSDSQSSAGVWQTGPQSFQFFGSGMHTVMQRIEGDFTATCRVDSYNGAGGEPVNRNAWVGLSARQFGDRLDWNWGKDFHLVQTAANGLRTSADSQDLGGSRVSSYALPAGHSWLRIARVNDTWTAWSSRDGRDWELGMYKYLNAPDAMDVGLFFSAQPQDARAHYHASVSEFSITPGLNNDLVLPEIPIAKHTSGDRFTGAAMAPSNNQIVVLRSSSAGLSKTTDGGKTWQTINGDLQGDDLAVRSVAIHPTDPQIILRACGSGATGRLWKSVDGGGSWQLLELDANFDGVGPSCLCGEVIAFDLRTPSTIYVGSESKGFFQSNDQGQSWVHKGMAGERITSVTVWPWEQHYPATARDHTHLCVTTCGDNWMPFLGRGPSSVQTESQVSRAYLSHDSVATLERVDERDDTGFYNAIFDKASQSTQEMRYATTHGIQAQIFLREETVLYPEEKHLEWFRPTTAIDATAMGTQKFGRVITHPLEPAVSGRLSRSQTWAYHWSWLNPQGDKPSGGLIATVGDIEQGEHWWFVFTDGVFFSTDGGETLLRVMPR